MTEIRPSGTSLFWFLSAGVGLALRRVVSVPAGSPRSSRVAGWALWAMLAGALALATWAWFF